MGFFVLGCAAKAAQQPPTRHRVALPRHAPRAATPPQNPGQSSAAHAAPPSKRRSTAKSRPKFRRARRSTVKTPRHPAKHNKKNIYMKSPRAENPGAYQKQKRLKAIWLISSGYHFLFLWRPAFCISGRQNPARRQYHTRTQYAPHWFGSNGRQTNIFCCPPHLCA